MSADPIIEKIKKLLRMKRGGTPDEIATALRLAQELAEKHGIDLADVNENDEQKKEQPIEHLDAVTSARIQWECKYCGMILQNFFNLQVMLRHPNFYQHRLTFIGTAWDIEIGLYVYNFLVKHFRREWKAKRGRSRNRQAFMYGMFVGLASKLAARRTKPTEAGIALRARGVLRRSEYMEAQFGKTQAVDVEPDHTADSAYRRGFVAGRETEIRSGVNGGAATSASELPEGSERKLLG